MMFGCCSFPGNEVAPFAEPLALLKDRHLAPKKWAPGIKFAEIDAYENLDVYAFNKICWPDYLDTETKVKIFYRYLEINPLFPFNQNITILKKEKKPNDVINIIYVFDRENNTINFPNTEMLGFINSC